MFGDTGPENIIGEASYAIAKTLGINPDPAVGGADSGVTYIVFKSTETVLSRREFRTDVLATVCVWLKGGGGPSLQSFVDALRTPAFTLAAGRKAFPLMLPCRPEIIAVTTVFGALQNYDMVTRPGVRDLLEARGMNTRDRGTPVRVYADAEAVLGATGSTHEHRQSRDVPVNRAKWQFDVRREVVVTWTEAPHG